MKNSNDPFGNRTRYLTPCYAVPQPTAPPLTRIYQFVGKMWNFVTVDYTKWSNHFAFEH
jgi:hypothetical protein